MSSLIPYLTAHHTIIIPLFIQQLRMAGVAVSIGAVLALPTGVYISRHSQFASRVLWVANAFQTVPQLALLGFFLVFFGLGEVTAISVLIFYTLMPMIRATYVGIRGIDRAIVAAGEGMGMTPQQILWRVQIPLALPMILTGVRLSTIIAVGGTTIMSLVGAGGLGQLIFTGMENLNNTEILAGGVLVAVETVGAGLIIDGLAKIVTSRGMVHQE